MEGQCEIIVHNKDNDQKLNVTGILFPHTSELLRGNSYITPDLYQKVYKLSEAAQK